MHRIDKYLSKIVEESVDAIVITGLDGRIIYWNRGAEELYGHKAEEVEGKSVYDLYPEELREKRRQWGITLQKKEALRNIRTRIYNKKGKLVDIILSLSLLRNEEGKPIAIVGISKDISREVRLEEKLREHGAALEKKVRELQGLYEISDLFREEMELEGFSGVLSEKIARLMDVEQCAIILYDDISMEFHPLSAVFGVADEDLSSLQSSLARVAVRLKDWPGDQPLISNTPEGDDKLIKEFVKIMGSRNILLAKLRVSGEFLGVLCLANKRGGEFTNNDIRLAGIIASRLGAALHNRTLFSKLKEHARRLEDKSKEVENFVYAISHDLKAPLISVQGYASALISEYGNLLNEEARYYVKRIMKNTELMSELISDLLELSRVGRITQPFEEIDLNSVLKDLCQERAYKYTGRGRRLKIEIGELPKVRGEKNRIIQVFTNLIDNAAKYMGEQEEPMVEVGCHTLRKEWRFYVKDNGMGIPPEYIDKVFQPFYRVPRGKPDDVEGTGLGLAIVKKIVEYHGGRTWAESEPGRGSVFYFTLPR